MYKVWSQKKTQAKFRSEEFELSFDDFKDIWGDQFAQRGRHVTSICLARIDTSLPWSKENTHLVKFSDLARLRVLKTHEKTA